MAKHGGSRGLHVMGCDRVADHLVLMNDIVHAAQGRKRQPTGPVDLHLDRFQDGPDAGIAGDLCYRLVKRLVLFMKIGRVAESGKRLLPGNNGVEARDMPRLGNYGGASRRSCPQAPCG